MMIPPRPMMPMPMGGAPMAPGGAPPMPGGPGPMVPGQTTAPFEPPMNPQTIQRMALLHLLQQAPQTDPNAAMPAQTTMPKPYLPPTADGTRGRY